MIISPPIKGEFFMGALFHDFPFFQHHYIIRIAYRTESMGHYYNGFVLEYMFKVVHNHPFIVGIQRIGRFIKKDIIRVFVYCTCNEYALLLPLTDAYAVRANFGVVP